MSTPPVIEISRYAFSDTQLSDIRANSFAQNYWPLVYVLSDANMRLAYVGETADAVARMTTHLKHDAKRHLSVVHLITSLKFNKSATLDIESNLIKYMSADGRFKLLNGNLGLADHNYYQKDILYADIFQQLWDQLRAKGVTQHSLDHLDNSDLFKYSPYKALSPDQRQGLLGIMHSLVSDTTRTLVVQGGAGTGKSVLAIFLFKLLQSENDDFNFREFSSEEAEIKDLLIRLRVKYGEKPRMALVVPMSSFRTTLKKAFSNIAGLKSSMVIGPSELAKQHYDIVLVDEAHRLRQRTNLGAYYGAFDKTSIALGFDPKLCSEVDWVRKQSSRAVFFYDTDQTIKPSDAAADVFSALKASPDTEVQELVSQFRVLGGNPYVKFIDDLLNARLPESAKHSSRSYEFKLFDSFREFQQKIQEKENEVGLSRMIAGYSWPWISNKERDKFDIEIENIKLRWNSTSSDWINAAGSATEVGCIHTTQGYDLNYAGIIFGREIGYDKTKGEIIIRPELYFDRNGKQSITDPDQLKRYILNIYKTIMLRGIRGTFVYACDPDFREYLARHIPREITQPVNVVELPQVKVQPYVNAVPLYSLLPAAGSFSEQQQAEIDDWIVLPDGERADKSLFACKVQGESMNRIIPNGAVCLFRTDQGGSRNGKIVLVEHSDSIDDDSGSHYAVKEYESIKSEDGDAWAHQRILLKPRSSDPAFETLVLSEDDTSRYRVVGEFLRVLD
ncbi:DNA/RNA helicase domain-containing protein [Pseudohongiella acticola]|jgi:uncharacterized protein|uniref:DNA/RNA helicase domain-containing protein n=1 Tax=Pseudohongiella acticola TaxID=1524254 RepID=UPI0030ED5DDD